MPVEAAGSLNAARITFSDLCDGRESLATFQQSSWPPKAGAMPTVACLARAKIIRSWNPRPRYPVGVQYVVVSALKSWLLERFFEAAVWRSKKQ